MLTGWGPARALLLRDRVPAGLTVHPTPGPGKPSEDSLPDLQDTRAVCWLPPHTCL